MPALLAEHIDLLVCPVCHSALVLTAETVDCSACGRRYPIVDGLPVLIATRAKGTTSPNSSPSPLESASNHE